MLQGIHSVDWLKYNASYDLADESFGFKSVGKNVRLHCLAVVPNPENISIGDNVRIDAFTILSAHEIVIGSYVHIGAHCVLSGQGKIEFQDFSAVSHGSKIFSSTDDLESIALTGTTVPHELQSIITADVMLEKHAIIGANSVVLPGVKLGFGAVVGAQSLVKDSVRSLDVVAGAPAKFIKQRARRDSRLSGPSWEDLEQCCRAMV